MMRSTKNHTEVAKKADGTIKDQCQQQKPMHPLPSKACNKWNCEVEPNRLTSQFIAALYNSGEDMAWQNYYKIGYIGVPIEEVN